MKKLMFVSMFAFAGLMASANNTKKEVTPKTVVKMETGIKPNPYALIFTCGGNTYVACCFSTYWEAQFFDINPWCGNTAS